MSPSTWFRLLGLSVVTIALGFVGPALTQAPKGKKYALLVGVKSYKHAGLPDLAHTENDVEELAAVLKGKNAGFDEVVLLTTTRAEKDDKAKPTAANVRAELKRLLKKVDKDDLVLIGLAGHGLQLSITDPKDAKREKTESFFCPADARPTRSKTLKDHEETMIPLFELFDELEDSGAGVKLMMVDACRDEPKLGRNPDVDNLPRPSRGTAALFSCKSGEKAFETAKLGKGHGVFFHHVIEGLKGKAKNTKGEVSWNSLSEYVTSEVSDVVPVLIGGGAQQTPHAITNLVGKPPILLRAEAEVAQGPLGKGNANSIGMGFVLVEKGEFKMGSPADEAGRHKENEEQHSVKLTKDFYLGKYEVTQKQFRTVTGYNPSFFSKNGKGKGGKEYKYVQPGDGKDKVKDLRDEDLDNFPVENVAYEDAQDFIDELNRREEKHLGSWKYSLPTEAQWEYACRGRPSSTTPFHFKAPSDSLSSKQANFDGRSPYGGAGKGDYLQRTSKVGAYAANSLGLYDMHGNVWEWCADWYGENYYTKPAAREDPPGPSEGVYRVFRGGCWSNNGQDCRAAVRMWNTPDLRYRDIGFRIALVPRK